MSTRQAGARQSPSAEEPEALILISPLRIAVVVALVVAVVAAGYVYRQQSSEIERLETANRALVLEQGQNAGVGLALAEVRATARANERRLQRTIDARTRELESVQAQLTSIDAQATTSTKQVTALAARIAKTQAQLVAARKELKKTKVALASAQKTEGAAGAGAGSSSATTPGSTAPTLTAEEQATKRFCDALGNVWYQYPSCRSFYKEN